MTKSRFSLLHETITKQIDRGLMPGAVSYIYKKCEIELTMRSLR
jgi:hypothetical protein